MRRPAFADRSGARTARRQRRAAGWPRLGIKAVTQAQPGVCTALGFPLTGLRPACEDSAHVGTMKPPTRWHCRAWIGCCTRRRWAISKTNPPARKLRRGNHFGECEIVSIAITIPSAQREYLRLRDDASHFSRTAVARLGHSLPPASSAALQDHFPLGIPRPGDDRELSTRRSVPITPTRTWTTWPWAPLRHRITLLSKPAAGVEHLKKFCPARRAASSTSSATTCAAGGRERPARMGSSQGRNAARSRRSTTRSKARPSSRAAIRSSPRQPARRVAWMARPMAPAKSCYSVNHGAGRRMGAGRRSARWINSASTRSGCVRHPQQCRQFEGRAPMHTRISAEVLRSVELADSRRRSRSCRRGLD